MLDNCKNAQERWGGVHQLIDHWLKERQQLILGFCRLSDDADLAHYSSGRAAHLRRLCQVMVDYVSAGHFEVYDQLAREAETFGDGGEQLLADLLPSIQASTGIVLDFNDGFDSEDAIRQAWDTLPQRLAQLGEALAARFALEDRLIAQLHTAHQARATG